MEGRFSVSVGEGGGEIVGEARGAASTERWLMKLGAEARCKFAAKGRREAGSSEGTMSSSQRALPWSWCDEDSWFYGAAGSFFGGSSFSGTRGGAP